jgi:REP element-mobilizing transposase RayT
MWEIFSQYLYFVSAAYGLKIQAFVLMANHYHLMATATPDELAAAMNYLQREVSKEINRRSGRINQVWGGRYHRSVIANSTQQMNVYKYIYRNPVEAGVCARVEDYPHSTLRGLIGFDRLLIPVHDSILLSDPEWTLAWLNTKPVIADFRQQLRRALRRKRYQFGRDKDRHLPSFAVKLL